MFRLLCTMRAERSPFKAEIAGIDLSFKANVEVGSNENKVNLKEISSTLKAINIQASPSPESLFAAEKLTLEGGDYDLGARSITASRIALSKGRLDVGRDAGGKINWLQLFQAKGAAEDAPEAVPASATVPAWKFLAKSFEIDGFNTRISDLTTHSDKPVLSMQGLQAKLVDVDGKSPMGFTLDFQLERGGSAKLSGIVNPSIPSVEAAINVSGVDLTSLQPYIEPYVTLVVESASVSTRGNLSYGVPGTAQKTAYEGDFRLDHLRLADADSQKPYLSWDAMQIPRLKFMLQPNGLDIQEIKINKPVGELIIGEDKTLNLKKVLKNRQSSNTTPAPSVPGDINNQETFPYHIARVQVEKGNMIFADLSLRPRFMTRIHDIKGEITALSSAQNAQAKISLDGHVDEYGTAKIRGVIRPEDFGRSSDVEMVFRNLEMKNLSPYSGKFAGRLIKSGKFSADLKYQIQDYKMIGDNKIILQNLALGEYVDEQSAANLPLDLAIALLKDSNGRIDIGLPVTGDLNDPQFSIGPVIWELFASMITKVAMAPFSALGNMFGGEVENFDEVEFASGSADLPPPEKEKLLKLADVLKNRPQLKLIIQGRYSPEADGKEFKDLSIRRIVASRLGAQPSPDEDPRSPDFTDSTTQNLMEELYKERIGKPSIDELEKGIETGTITPRLPENHREESKEPGVFSKMADNLKLYKIIPGGKSSKQAALWAGELYTRLVESEKVPEESFLQLARGRAQSIAGELEGEGRIPKGRMSIKDPEPVTGDEHPSAKFSLDAL